MSATVDANLLLHATDESSRFHAAPRARLEALAQRPEIVHLFGPVVMAYLRLSTHPAIFDAPLSPEQAIENIERLLERPHLQTAGERERFWATYRDLATDAAVRGNLVADAHVVALMRENGVRAIWTHDRDYRRLPGIEALDPFPEWSPAGRIARAHRLLERTGRRPARVVVGSLRARADERSAVG